METLRDVCVDDGYFFDLGADDTGFFASVIKTHPYIPWRESAQYCNAVIGFFPAKYAVITQFPECALRKLAVLRFCLLKAEDIGQFFFNPPNEYFRPCPY